jgi:serine phosphatase RsbU (regulator of sigma subunit)
VLYSDGLSEAADGAGSEYGEARLMQFFKAQKSIGPVALTTACLEDLENFSSAPRSDDLTLMMLHRTA